MIIHRIYGFFMRRFRPARVAAIAAAFPVLKDREATVLDVGGGAWPWSELNAAARITILNVAPARNPPADSPWLFVQGDGTRLEYAENAFDLVFSNSVIEHVGDWENQKRFAGEMLRCGKQIYCQTPNKWFFVEPHLIAPFLHWLPFRVSRKLVRWCSIWGIVNRPSQEAVDEVLKGIRLLSCKDVILLFPECNIARERFLGMTKSFVVTRTSDSGLKHDMLTGGQ
jgi:SAM-dependent methyltransferase